jgi:hypothetical protein
VVILFVEEQAYIFHQKKVAMVSKRVHFRHHSHNRHHSSCFRAMEFAISQKLVQLLED